MSVLFLLLSGGVTVIVPIAAYRFFMARLPAPPRRETWADVTTAQWPGLISMLLPRAIRAVWNRLLLLFSVVLLGVPHLLALIRVMGPARSATDMIWYAAGLAWWALLVCLPAFTSARLRLSQRAA